MDALLRHLADWKPFAVLVVGDFMLDQLIYGDAERLIADAPVPVLQVRRQESVPGGAANLCVDLAAMNARVLACGLVGDDAQAGDLCGLMNEAGIDISGLITDPTRPTTLKRNYIGLAQSRHPQKMFRVDHESREPIEGDLLDTLLTRIDAALAEVDVVCIEDYGKGVCTDTVCQEVIVRARAAGLPVPACRRRPWSRWR